MENLKGLNFIRNKFAFLASTSGADASFKKVNLGNDTTIYAYVREKGNHKVLVILNLTKKEQDIKITDKSLQRLAYNIFTGVNEQLSEKRKSLSPWSYFVYEYPVAGAN